VTVTIGYTATKNNGRDPFYIILRPRHNDFGAPMATPEIVLLNVLWSNLRSLLGRSIWNLSFHL